MNTCRYIFCLIAALLIPALSFSQGEFNNWYFGDQAGITFNSGSPAALTNSAMMTQRTSISVSDSAGNLLFYSDGFDVYNRNHQKMPNGSGLNMTICDQHIAVVQKVDDDSSYYLFTFKYTDTPLSNYGGIRYSVINMRLDNGLGDIVAGQKNVPFQTADVFSYLFIPVRHQNSRDAWLLTKTCHNTNNFLAYLIDSIGLHTTPVVSPAEYPIVPIPYCNPGTMRVSPDGTLLVCPYMDTVGVYSFNASTGHVARLFYILSGTFPFFYSWDYMEFSGDSKYLYVSTGDWPWTPADILQYDAAKRDSAQFKQSAVLVASMNRGVHFQRGPDGKIYGVESGVDSMCVINHPELQGTACDFQRHAIWTHYKITREGLPDMLSRYFLYLNSDGNCQGVPVNFLPNTFPPADSVHWNFGDPFSGNLNVSTTQHASHIYNTPGTYMVHLFVRHNDKRVDSTSRTILILPGVTVTAGQDRHICTGDSVTFTAGGCSSCTFLWTSISTGPDTLGNSQTITAGSAGIYIVTATGINGCTASDTVQLFVDSIPAITNTATGKTICTGETTDIALSSPVSGTVFHWTASLTSGNVVGFSPDSGQVISQILTNNLAILGSVTYHVIPEAGSCQGEPVDFLVTVTPGDSARIVVSASGNNVCAGTTVTFTAIPENGGTSPYYQWKVNGTGAGTGPVFSYTPQNGDKVCCVLTSSQPACITNNPAVSDTVVMAVNPLLPVSVTLSSSATSVCFGTEVTFTAFAVNPGSSPGYQWKVNGLNINNATGSTYTYIPTGGDMVTCEVTSSEECSTGNPATSLPVTITVTAPQPVGISIAASLNPFCAGNPVTFTASASNAGNLPLYQWKVNANNANNASNAVYTYVPSNGDLVSCVVTSSASCITGNPATSPSILMTVITPSPVSVSVTASENPFCAGSSVTFTASAVNAGSTPGYQWKVNAINAGNATNAVYSYIPASGDVVSCIVTSSLSCVSGSPAVSNVITMAVNTGLPAGVSITASANPFCPGSMVTFTATPVNGGTAPTYQWKVNGTVVSINASYVYSPISGDVVTCVMTSNLNCVTSNPATSAALTMVARSLPIVSFSNCFDTVTFLNAKPYRLKGGLPAGGQYSGPGVNSATGFFTPSSAGTGLKNITYGYTNVYTCMNSATTTILVKPTPSFTCGGMFTDPRDDKVYSTVLIGTQCWMNENLSYGTEIPDNTPQTDNCLPEKYLRNFSFLIFNSVYQWDELMRYETSPGTQGLCPPGWHVPTEAEWIVLLNNYSGPGQAGTFLKDLMMPNGFDSYQYGFLYQNNLWSFTSGDYAGSMYWTSTVSGSGRAIARGINNYLFSVSRYDAARSDGFSVRCVKD